MRNPPARLLSSVAFVLCALTVWGQQGNECTLVGAVHVGRNAFPPHRVQVNLETRGATMASVYTDDEGRFTFSHLEGNLYHVVINDDEYLPYRESVSLTPVTNPI